MRSKRIIVSGVLILPIVFGIYWKFKKHADPEIYRMGTVERGALVQSVRATGVVQPITLIQVGTQVNGPVRKLYVDFNDTVKQGDLVAQIDPIVYEARLAQDKASLSRARASLRQAQVKLAQAGKILARDEELSAKNMISREELEAAQTNRDTLIAAFKAAEADVDQAKATLRLSQANLDYTTIRSPVSGVVISRNVSEGQTVVANLSAQVLFVVAADLKQVQIEASIPEADIGKISKGQEVTFTVDAYEEEFRGTVAQVRLAANNVQNVVTYPVVILSDNPGGKLFPGMTADLNCIVMRREDVLKIPNAALRFKPPANASGGKSRNKEAGENSKKPRENFPGAQRGPRVWIQNKAGKPPVPVSVKTGITDGFFTELQDAGSLTEGQSVILGLTDAGASKNDTVNPFAPQMQGRGRNRV